MHKTSSEKRLRDIGLFKMLLAETDEQISRTHGQNRDANTGALQLAGTLGAATKAL